MQNKKKGKGIKKEKKHKHHNKYGNKRTKNEPAARGEETTQQKKRIVTGNAEITRTINKNIEKVMMERATNSKEVFKFLK